MSSFRDIALNVIDSDTLLGRSMYNVNKKAHEDLEKLMKEWEKRTKSTLLKWARRAKQKIQPSVKRERLALMPIESNPRQAQDEARQAIKTC